MKLRFKVDQASCFRDGVDAPTSIVDIDVNPSELDQNERDLIADRLHLGIEVRQRNGTGLVVAKHPSLEGLLHACMSD